MSRAGHENECNIMTGRESEECVGRKTSSSQIQGKSEGYLYHPSNLLPPATCLSPVPPTSTATHPNSAITNRTSHAASAVIPMPVLSCIAKARSTAAAAALPIRAPVRGCSSGTIIVQAGGKAPSTVASSWSRTVCRRGEEIGDGGRGTSQGSTTTGGKSAGLARGVDVRESLSIAS